MSDSSCTTLSYENMHKEKNGILINDFNNSIEYDSSSIRKLSITSKSSLDSDAEKMKAKKSDMTRMLTENYNGLYVLTTNKNSDKDFKPVCEGLQDHTLATGHLVYETPLDNASVLYDDIGELVSSKPLELRKKTLDMTRSFSEEIIPKSSDSEGPTNSKSSHLHRNKECLSTKPKNSAFQPYSREKLRHRRARKVRSYPSAIDDESDSEPSITSQDIAKMIGNLHIAEYEGSPRRYGPRAASISYDDKIKAVTHQNKQLSESSEPSNSFDSKPHSKSVNKCINSSNKSKKIPKHDMSIQTDLNHSNGKRKPSGNSYIGNRLAHFSKLDHTESPKRLEVKPLNSKMNSNDHHSMPSLNNNSRPSPTIDFQHHPSQIQDMLNCSQHFTISPATTDNEINDEDSVASIAGSHNSSGKLLSSMPILEDGLSSGHDSEREEMFENQNGVVVSEITNSAALLIKKQISEIEEDLILQKSSPKLFHDNPPKTQSVPKKVSNNIEASIATMKDLDLSDFDILAQKIPEDFLSVNPSSEPEMLDADHGPEIKCLDEETLCEALKEIKLAIQQTRPLHFKPAQDHSDTKQPIWVPRCGSTQRFFDNGSLGEAFHEENVDDEGVYDEDLEEETEKLLKEKSLEKGIMGSSPSKQPKSPSKEVLVHEPALLVEGVLFRAYYLGSTHLVYDGKPTKEMRMLQAEEAVTRIKAPEGENQPNTEVDLFISTEKIMVLNTSLKEVMMDHPLRTISYIADIGDLVVLMAKRPIVPLAEEANSSESKTKKNPRIICHVFESEDAQFIAQSIGQAFQVAYMEFLKANGIEDSSFVRDMDYQEVLNSQEILGNELEMFSKKEKQKEVKISKKKGEILGLVIMESGWGSMLPTVVIANMAQSSPAARCGQLNIGDQIIALDDTSMVGLPIATCQAHIKNTRHKMLVKLTVVPCAPVVEVRIKRPDTKYQLGFSVQNGVICSLLRGGIAERGGVRVGHRIIEINGESVVAVPHDKIVTMLATSVGEIQMKTMPTSMFRLLTGQETPLYI